MGDGRSTDWNPEATVAPEGSHTITAKRAVGEWTVDDVCSWARESVMLHEADAVARALRDQAMDGTALHQLQGLAEGVQNDMLKMDLGVSLLGDRLRLLKALANLSPT